MAHQKIGMELLKRVESDLESMASVEQFPTLEGKLVGIKGQYWLFEDGRVWNVRSHAGYRIAMSAT